MRVNVNIISWILLLGALLTSCTEGDDMTKPDEPLMCDVILNVGLPNGMRMANSVVQEEGKDFRGMGSLMVIPFQTEGAAPVSAIDQPLISLVSGTTTDRVTDQPYYYMQYCSMMPGTNRVLAYGEAYAPENASKTQYGALETNLARKIPQDITFNLQSICSSTETSSAFFADGLALAAYLTDIANTTGWSNTSDSQMKGLYLDFINANSEGTGLIGGSAANVAAYVKDLKAQLTTIHDNAGSSDDVKTLCDAIIAKIEANSSLNGNDYPRSKDLPDGAAVLRWTSSKFEIRIQTTTLDNINGINRYTYPAALWYYVNSSIQTSTEEVKKDAYQNASDWEGLLSSKYTSGSEVMKNTKSVAVDDPLQYGVARLQMTLKPITASPLKDSKDNVVAYDADHPLTLTGIIIGGQHTVGFDFKPQDPKSDVDARFIYDSTISDELETGENAGTTINTLVLQSYDGEKVPVVLEFLNGTSNKFYGKDGVIYPNTRFYLIGELDPAKGTGTGDVTNRVFTQDHTTTATMTVNSLKNAYSCMPDLLEPRLEIGVQVVTQWIQSTTTTVKL